MRWVKTVLPNVLLSVYWEKPSTLDQNICSLRFDNCIFVVSHIEDLLFKDNLELTFLTRKGDLVEEKTARAKIGDNVSFK